MFRFQTRIMFLEIFLERNFNKRPIKQKGKFYVTGNDTNSAFLVNQP